MQTGMEIAVIGMAGRFPGAKHTREFWHNLKNGIESITFFFNEDLEESVASPAVLQDPNYVKAFGRLEDVEYFDASFFDYTPREGEIMDPQMRVFHECVWSALEDGGYDPRTYDGLIGLYAGATPNFYWEALALISGKSVEMGQYAANHSIRKDYLCTRISYKLNLMGPSFTLNTACSTSLVAIHLACQGILGGECEMALAGGITIYLPTKNGYMYQEGMINSPDGHCRAFDRAAKGTVCGSGGGVVLLKRLEEAITGRDHIYAVIKGSAVNNDGIRKAGFTAPSVEGQAETIQMALRAADVEPESISYVETHGTGTPLGDLVEIEALKLAFDTRRKHFCRIGSVKTNIGHLDSAAGAAGFIKTVLALWHRLLPPSLHFETPNPGIDFENSPFYVNTTLKEWTRDGGPLRAGVSSFGIGGTNAHVILEQAPVIGHSSLVIGEKRKEREYQLILLSAKTETALEQSSENLVEYLNTNPQIPLADIAYTLQVGRAAFPHRRTTLCSTTHEAAAALAARDLRPVYTFCSKDEKKYAVFMFAGLGSQYPNMGLDLYHHEPGFREELDRCFHILKPMLGYDLKNVLYPDEHQGPGDRMNDPEIAQLVIFVFEYALARLLMKWGIIPRAMIGYSFGEYTAACLAGVFSLEEVLKLVVLRSELVRKTPEGAMLSVPIPSQELKPLLGNELSIAIDNGPSCVVAGSPGAVDDLERQLKEKRCLSMRVQASRAVHSPMMDPIVKEFAQGLRQIQLKEPKIPCISNVTGNWLTPGEAVDPQYWAAHLRTTMQFAKGIRTLTTRANAILVEVGPGRDLNALVIRHIEDKPDIKTVDLIPAQEKDISAVFFLLNRIGRLWHWGVNPDWNQFHTGENRNRVPLPTYPFERQRCWIEGNPYKFEARQWGENAPLQRKTDIADWFYIPAWKQTVPPLLLNPDDLKENRQRWLICVDDRGIGTTLAKRMQEKGHEVLQVRKGDRFSRLNHREYTINVRERADYETLIKDLISANKEPEMIVHLWSVDAEQAGEGEQPGIEVFKTRLDSGFNSLLFLIQAMAAHKLALTVIEPADIPRFIQVVVITNNAQPLPGDEKISPGQAAVLGLCRTIPLEYQNIRCRSIDLALTGTGQRQQAPLVGHLSAELLSQNTDLTTAYRENTRWVQYFEPFRPGHHQGCPRQLKERGVYLITGGLGRDSFVRAKYLAETVRARLVLVGRSKLPDRQQWDQWRHTHDDDDPINRKIKQVREIEESGGEVLLISADAANEDEMRSVMRQIDERFGQLHGVIHAAGITSIDSSVMIPGIGSKETEWHFKPKVYGLYTLEKVLMGRPLDFCLLTSSIASFFGGVGLSAYTAASIFMDIYTHWHNQISPVPWMSLNWEGSTPRETADIFHRLLNLGPIPQVLISKVDAQKRMEERFKPKIDPRESEVNQSKADTPLQRPELLSPYAAPANEIQEKLVQIWENFFGIAPLGIKDDFFELKGDSLKAVMMAAKIYKEFNVEVSLAEFFHRPTIEKLADYITAAARSECFSIQPVEKKEYSGLSSAQKRMYILQQMYPHITAYNIPLVRELDEKPDYERLERGFRQLIDRHENLRTSFMMIGGETLQKVNENWHFDIERYENIQEGEEERKTVDTFVRPFDLSRAPLFRAGVIETSRERYLLMVDQHHIVSDAVSHHILIHDFQVLEAGKKLPPLKLQYKDYSQWQNSEQGNRAMKEQETYWLRQFERDIPGLKIPTDYDRPQIINFEGNYIKFSLEKETYDKVKAFTRETGTTLYMFLFSIFNILLYKYTRQEDIVVGSTVTGRKYVDLQNIIGMFVNMMPMRCRLRPDKPFKEFLMEVKEKVLAAVENQDYQFDRLVSALGLKRDPSGNPLFNVVFNMINVDGGEAGDTNLKVLSYEYKHEATVFDLILSASEGTEMVTMALKYSTQLFKQTTIEKMIERYVDIINHVLANSEITLEDIKVSHGLLATTSSKQKYEENVFGF